MKGIVFDLDLTLVDSAPAENARRARDWRKVYSLIPEFRLYDGMADVFAKIRGTGTPVAIVSTAPGIYVSNVASYFSIPYNTIVAYHDAKPIKPHPAGMLKAAGILGIAPGDIVNFGDRAIDIQAGYAAGMRSFGCLWGTKEPLLLQQCASDGKCGLITSPSDILDLF